MTEPAAEQPPQNLTEDLYEAAMYGYSTDFLRLLAGPNVDINAVNDVYGHTVFTLMCSQGYSNMETLEAVLKMPKLDVNQVVGDYKRSGLICAVSSGSVPLVERIMQIKGVDTGLRDSSGRTALHLAVSSAGTVEMVATCLKLPGVDINAQDSEGYTSLHLVSALYSNGPEIAEILLAAGANASAVAKNGYTPLHSACEQWSREDLVRRLLQVPGINVNARATDDDRNTPLSMSLRRGESAVVELLCAVPGIDPNLAMADGQTGLGQAIGSWSTSSLQSVLKLGSVDPNIANTKTGETALIQAVKNSWSDGVHILLDNPRVKPRQTNSQGEDPFLLACQNQDVDMVSLFLKVVPQPITGPKELVTLLAPLQVFAAVKSGSIEALHQALDAGGSINSRGPSDVPLLTYAVQQSCSLEMLDALLAEPHIDPMVTDSNGNTILHTALRSGSVPIATRVIGLPGVQINKEGAGDSPLICAVGTGSAELVNLVLAHGADVNQQRESDGYTACIAAINYYQYDMLDLLLEVPHVNVNLKTKEKGAPLVHWMMGMYDEERIKKFLARPDVDLNAAYKDYNDREADPLFDAIANYKSQEIIDLLLNMRHGPPSQDLFIMACERGTIELVDKLLGMGADPDNLASDNVHTPLWTAVSRCSEEVVKRLLSVPGIAVNPVGPKEASALVVACSYQYTAIVDLLLAAPKIDINQPCGDSGDTPLIAAISWWGSDLANKLLALPGIDVNRSSATDPNRTPLSKATDMGQTDLAAELLKRGAKPLPTPPATA